MQQNGTLPLTLAPQFAEQVHKLEHVLLPVGTAMVWPEKAELCKEFATLQKAQSESLKAS
jgi:hypothetical protein